MATISITKHASASLGDVVFVELPQVGKDIKAGGAYPSCLLVLHDFGNFYVDQIGAVESVKAAADIVRAKKSVL